jgi:hypothetical protein
LAELFSKGEIGGHSPQSGGLTQGWFMVNRGRWWLIDGGAPSKLCHAGACYHHNLAGPEGEPRARWAQKINVINL